MCGNRSAWSTWIQSLTDVAEYFCPRRVPWQPFQIYASDVVRMCQRPGIVAFILTGQTNQTLGVIRSWARHGLLPEMHSIKSVLRSNRKSSRDGESEQVQEWPIHWVRDEVLEQRSRGSRPLRDSSWFWQSVGSEKKMAGWEEEWTEGEHTKGGMWVWEQEQMGRQEKGGRRETERETAEQVYERQRDGDSLGKCPIFQMNVNEHWTASH